MLLSKAFKDDNSAPHVDLTMMDDYYTAQQDDSLLTLIKCKACNKNILIVMFKHEISITKLTEHNH